MTKRLAWRKRPVDRPDQHELAAERMAAGLGPFEPLPETLRRFDRKRQVLLFLLGAIALLLYRGAQTGGPPSASGSCTRPAFDFDHTSVRYYGTVRWSVAGPAGSSVVITADSASVTTGRLAGPVALKDCRAQGRFGVPLPDGTHLIRVFLVSGDGTTTVLGTKDLVVHAPH